MNGMDFVYYRFVDKRATADVFKTFEHETNLGKIIFQVSYRLLACNTFYTFYWFLMVYLYNKVKAVKPEPSK